MISPYKFRETLFYETQSSDFDQDFLAKRIYIHFKESNPEKITLNKNKISFSTFSNLFNLEHQVEIFVEEKKERLKYIINYGEIYKIILLVLLFALFFVKFSWWIYTIIAVVFSIAVVTVNIHYVNSYIKRNIIAALSGVAIIEETFISRKQKSWIKDPTKCPACGEGVNEYTTKCTNCGLKISGKKFKSIKNVTSSNIDVSYTIKENFHEKNSR